VFITFSDGTTWTQAWDPQLASCSSNRITWLGDRFAIYERSIHESVDGLQWTTLYSDQGNTGQANFVVSLVSRGADLVASVEQFRAVQGPVERYVQYSLWRHDGEWMLRWEDRASWRSW
jgi:hypothetical protein